jgi:aminopeptidase
MTPLEQACSDIIHKNLVYSDEQIYLLYDTESPLAIRLSNAYKAVLPTGSVIREFKNPPQPLYRGGLLNPENPHITEQNRIITSHNLAENIRVGLNHHELIETSTAEDIDPQIASILSELLGLPKGSIVILVQSSNFRLSTFRIRLELFNIGVHVIEFNHLAYIKEEEFETFEKTLDYHTDSYITQLEKFQSCIDRELTPSCHSSQGHILHIGPVERARGNTGDYSMSEHKGGTFPIGEIFTEAIDLETVHGEALVESYPGDSFEVVHDTPFLIQIEKGRVLPSQDFPPMFQKVYNLILEAEGEVMVREFGLGLNTAITRQTPLSDINFYERKIGVHLSLGKKHGIYGKKLPKATVQRYHIDIFLDLGMVYMGEECIFAGGKWVW